MPTIAAGNSASFTLDNDDVLTASGKGVITFTPTGQSAFTSYLDGLTTFQAFKRYTGVSVAAKKDVVYSIASDASVAPSAVFSVNSTGASTGLVGPAGTSEIAWGDDAEDISPASADRLLGRKVDGTPKWWSVQTLMGYFRNIVASITPTASTQTNGSSDAVTLALGSTTTAGSLIVGRDTVVTVTGTTGKLSAGGHIIGAQSGVIMSQTGTATHDLVIGQEAQVQNANAGTTITLLPLHVVHLKNHAGTTTMLNGYRPVLASGDNTGTITYSVDYFSENWTAVTGAPSVRYTMLNEDPSKIIQTAGRVIGAASQELAPAASAGYQAARYYWGVSPSAIFSPVALIANFVFFAPLKIARRMTLTEIGCQVTTAAASSNIQMALYKITDGVLSAPIVTTANISSATTGAKTASISATVEAGNYVVGVNSSGTPQINFNSESGLASFFGATTATGRETTPTAALTFGAWGTPTLAFAEVGQSVPHIWVRGS